MEYLSADMREWTNDCREQLKVDHENEVFLKFVLLAKIIGYRRVSYGIEYPTSVAEPSFSYYANYTTDWQEKFIERHAKHHGSRVAYGKRSAVPPEGSSPYYWTRSDFFREAEANMVKFEVLKEIPGRGGTEAIVGLSDLTEADGPLIRQKANILIGEVAAAMELRLLTKNLPQLFVQLTEQERKYLLWVLDGKTSGEIADIMGIRKAVVDNMQRSLPDRFDRKGAFATAFLAYRLGLLS